MRLKGCNLQYHKSLTQFKIFRTQRHFMQKHLSKQTYSEAHFDEVW